MQAVRKIIYPMSVLMKNRRLSRHIMLGVTLTAVLALLLVNHEKTATHSNQQRTGKTAPALH